MRKKTHGGKKKEITETMGQTNLETVRGDQKNGGAPEEKGDKKTIKEKEKNKAVVEKVGAMTQNAERVNESDNNGFIVEKLKGLGDENLETTDEKSRTRGGEKNTPNKTTGGKNQKGGNTEEKKLETDLFRS